MPPRYTYWTIIMEGKPTAFRARTQDELLPTLKQLQARHPDAVLMWFARGRLWKSEEESREALVRKRRPEERRGPAWRPGGSHEDPRARFKVPRDEKRRRFRERLFREHAPDDREVPVGDKTDRPLRPRGPRHDRPARPWSKDRPPAREGDQPWKPKWQPNRRDDQRGGERDRAAKPNRPSGRPQGENRGWKPNRPPGGGSGPGGVRGRGHRPPGGGRKGGGGRGGSSR
jgi:translation initiation factor IF-2